MGILEAITAVLSRVSKLLPVFIKTPEARAEHAKLLEKILKDVEDFSRILDNPNRKAGDTSDIEDFFRSRK